MPVSTCARLRWLLKASLIPPLLLSLRREGAGRGPCRWERIEGSVLAKVPANPSLLERERQGLSTLLFRLAHKHRGHVVRLRLVWLSALPPCQLLPPLLLRSLDRVVRLELEVGKGG